MSIWLRHFFIRLSISQIDSQPCCLTLLRTFLFLKLLIYFNLMNNSLRFHVRFLIFLIWSRCFHLNLPNNNIFRVFSTAWVIYRLLSHLHWKTFNNFIMLLRIFYLFNLLVFNLQWKQESSFKIAVLAILMRFINWSYIILHSWRRDIHDGCCLHNLAIRHDGVQIFILSVFRFDLGLGHQLI